MKTPSIVALALASLTVFLPRTASAQTWSFFYANTLASIYEIQFPSAGTGYMATSSNVVKTVNGGTTWSTSGPGNSPYSSVFFLNNDTGWVVGENGDIRKTVNGGASWLNQTNTGGGTIHLGKVAFASPLIGYAARNTTNSSGSLIRTADGGASWAVHANAMDGGSNARITDIQFTSTTTGYAAGAMGLYKTTDAGSTWSASGSGIPSGLQLTALDFPSLDTGFVAGDSGRIFKTVNAGAAWTSSATIAGLRFTAIDCLNGTVCYAAGAGTGSGKSGGYVYKTTNGGSSWDSSYSLATSVFSTIAFPTREIGFVAGTGGTVRKTDAIVSLNPARRPSAEAFDVSRSSAGLTLATPLAEGRNFSVTVTDLNGTVVWKSGGRSTGGMLALTMPAPARGVHVVDFRAGDRRHVSRVLVD